MNVLVVNCGSSSLKFQLINSETEEVAAKGLCERIGIDGRLVYQPTNGEKEVIEASMPTHTEAIKMVLDALVNEKTGVLKSLDEVEAIGHRVLHGGAKISDSCIINDEVISVIEECCDLGPLHNPANLMGIRACMELMPGKPNVAVFDTAFHQTMPKEAYMYALPYSYYEDYGIRRYGFHGTSHKYVAQRCAELMGKHMTDLRIITCHLGNGSSVAAIKGGRSIDTTMGFTPLSGLIMGTRTGDIDPAIVPFLMEKTGMTYEEIDRVMNKESGVLGISGVSSDMRELLAACAAGNEKAILAEKMYYYRIKKYIGAYAAALGGVDIILFTGGVGENQMECRREVCKDMEFMGIELDNEVNAKVRGEEAIISTPASKVKVVVIPTDEELLIASDTMDILNK